MTRTEVRQKIVVFMGQTDIMPRVFSKTELMPYNKYTELLP